MCLKPPFLHPYPNPQLTGDALTPVSYTHLDVYKRQVVEWIYGYPLFDSNSFYIYAMVPSGLATALLLVTVIRSQSPVRVHLLVGIVSLLGISFIPGSLNFYSHNISPIVASFFNDPYFWVILGLAIEAFCFALARAYLVKLIAIKNHQIQQQYTHDLETQLAQRTQEIQQQSLSLIHI